MEKVKIKLNRSIPKKFKKAWQWKFEAAEKTIRKGWSTWIYKEELSNEKKFSFGYFFPENNKLGINFPADWFDVIEEKNKVWRHK
ncbi:hypothetical protein Phi46:1_gp36 [Cellulophaga phage phi46:1]|uniref:hypothetical protein n=1 Tax=Cellulophaga phage phi46:1 TaxID=1327974 RepID=UPI000351BB26|nr:hypothetical protein Phi46:1_gp36 [Cellulophaga phage phi46:1]AGO47847.1 hypothetical protein Phi46:1_gp36 [Cellulophaga phage phi46:1]